MITWFSDKEIEIYFDITPKLNIRYPSKFQTKEEKKKIKKKPFINLEDLQVKIKDIKKDKEYTFKIEKDYTWDGASIPRIFWRIIGSNQEPIFLIPSLIHDVLCENHHFIKNDRYLATKIFDKLLIVSDVNKFTRFIIFHSVDNYQKFCRW